MLSVESYTDSGRDTFFQHVPHQVVTIFVLNQNTVKSSQLLRCTDTPADIAVEELDGRVGGKVKQIDFRSNTW